MRWITKQKFDPDGKIQPVDIMIETDLDNSVSSSFLDSDSSSSESVIVIDGDSDDNEDEDKEEEEDEGGKEDQDEKEDANYDPDARRVLGYRDEEGQNDGQEILCYIRLTPEITCYKCHQWNSVNDTTGNGRDYEVVCTKCHSRITTSLWEV